MIDPTAFEMLWTILAAIGIHRLWLYEDVCASLRQYISWKWLTCPPCFAFWAGVLAIWLWSFTPNVVAFTVWWLLGIYAVERGVLSFYGKSDGVKKVMDLITGTPTKIPTTKEFEPTPEVYLTTRVAEHQPCTTCGN